MDTYITLDQNRSNGFISQTEAVTQAFKKLLEDQKISNNEAVSRKFCKIIFIEKLM